MREKHAEAELREDQLDHSRAELTEPRRYESGEEGYEKVSRRSAAAIEPTEDVGHVRESFRHLREPA
jgi:hypothetical protein